MRLLVADDHPLTLRGAVDVLKAEGFEVAGTASTVDDIVAGYRSLRPDVVLTDLRMGAPLAGLDAAREILSFAPDALIVCFSASAEASVVEDVLAAGCAGFVTKSGSGDELCSAVRAVVAGEQYVDARSAGALLRRMQRRSSATQALKLAAREVAVLRLAADGRSNSEIANELHVAESTVKTYISRTLEKLGAPDRTAAVAMALRQGLID